MRIICVLITLAVASACLADTIRLHPTARVAEGTDVVLRDIAALDGAAAVALGGVVVLPASERSSHWATMEAGEIRRQLNESGRVNWGRLELHGRAVRVAPGMPEKPDKKTTPAADAADEAKNDVSGPGAPTVRDLIAPRIATMLADAELETRIRFEARDANLLDVEILGRHVELKPVALAETTPIRVIVYEGDLIVASGTVRVGVQVRRTVVTTTTNVRRGEVLAQNHVGVAQRWVGPEIRPATSAESLGSLARSQIPAGTLITADHLRSVTLVHRGEQVRVRYLARGVSLEGDAVALEDGSAGDRIGIRLGDSRTRLVGRVSGPGLVIVAAAQAAKEGNR
ncbi:MAG: flagellar basal body P-ring formation chaperone FlgA [Planctomycetota bacterium]